MKITYLGHSAVKIETNGEVILIDPFLVSAREYDYKKDNIKNILITHAHNDHVGSALEISKATGANIIGVFELANYFNSKGIEAIGANLGGWIDFSWGKIMLCPASHSSTFANGVSGGVAVGFLLEIEGKLIYHAGDTGLIQDFKTFPKCSIAFVKSVHENNIKRKNIIDVTIWNAISIYISTVSKILITFGWTLVLEHLFLNSSISTSIGGKVL